MQFSGHKIPLPKSAPVQPVPETGQVTSFLDSVTKNIKITPATNWHSLAQDEISTSNQIIDIVNQNEFVDDILLDLESEESFLESYYEDLEEAIEEQDADLEEGRESSRVIG